MENIRSIQISVLSRKKKKKKIHNRERQKSLHMGFYISTKSTPIQRALGQGTGDLPSEVNSKTTLNHNQGQDKGKVR